MTLNDQWIFLYIGQTPIYIINSLSYFGLSAIIHPTISISGPASQEGPIDSHCLHAPNHQTGTKKLAVANSGNPTRHGNVKVPIYLSADDFPVNHHLIGGFKVLMLMKHIVSGDCVMENSNQFEPPTLTCHTFSIEAPDSPLCWNWHLGIGIQLPSMFLASFMVGLWENLPTT